MQSIQFCVTCQYISCCVGWCWTRCLNNHMTRMLLMLLWSFPSLFFFPPFPPFPTISFFPFSIKKFLDHRHQLRSGLWTLQLLGTADDQLEVVDRGFDGVRGRPLQLELLLLLLLFHLVVVPLLALQLGVVHHRLLLGGVALLSWRLDHWLLLGAWSFVDLQRRREKCPAKRYIHFMDSFPILKVFDNKTPLAVFTFHKSCSVPVIESLKWIKFVNTQNQTPPNILNYLNSTWALNLLRSSPFSSPAITLSKSCGAVGSGRRWWNIGYNFFGQFQIKLQSHRWSDLRPAPWATSSGRPPTFWCSLGCGSRLTWCQSLCHRCSRTLASSSASLPEYKFSQLWLWFRPNSLAWNWRESGSVVISCGRIQVISSPPPRPLLPPTSPVGGLGQTIVGLPEPKYGLSNICSHQRTLQKILLRVVCIYASRERHWLQLIVQVRVYPPCWWLDEKALSQIGRRPQFSVGTNNKQLFPFVQPFLRLFPHNEVASGLCAHFLESFRTKLNYTRLAWTRFRWEIYHGPSYKSNPT